MLTLPNSDAGGGAETSDGREAIRKLKSTDAPLYLSPSPDLSETARLASEYLFSSLKPYAPKCPFTRLLVKGFDAEQIWQQIDLQSEPLISSLQRKVQNFEKNPEEMKNWFSFLENRKPVEEKREDLAVEGEKEGFDDEEITAFDNGIGDEDEDEDEDEDDDDEEEEEEEEGEDEEGEGMASEKAGGDGVEDKFLKIDELEEYLERDEAREYGLKRDTKKGKKGARGKVDDDEGDEEENEEGEDDEDDDELGVMGLDDDEDDEAGNARYEDFFGAKGKNVKKKKSESAQLSDVLEMNEQFSDEDNYQKKRKLSTHERELERLRSTIEQMEKANIEPKAWTMQGEVTAVKRPKNSALEVDLDFEHNVRPAPVITEEVTASLEELIQKRVIEGRFDDVQKPPTLPSRAPREVKELDENKSKKGLGEIYEEEYAEKTGLTSVAMSISDQQKKEAKVLFKELCLKLDALSHFHFTPKPVIEDMAIQTNVPALAMEEIAPLAVSDAAMLAPEEVFSGKGDVKEETELNQAERKRRRAKKKRKFKAIEAKRMARTQQIPQPNKDATVNES